MIADETSLSISVYTLMNDLAACRICQRHVRRRREVTDCSCLGMNRALQIRHGSIDDSKQRRVFTSGSDLEHKIHQFDYGSVSDPLLHAFGTHQVLLACLTRRDSGTGSFLERDMPELVITLIFKFLDKTSIRIVKRLIGEAQTSSSVRKKFRRSSRDVSLNRFGSNARLAMKLLANMLTPYVTERRSALPTFDDENALDHVRKSMRDTTNLLPRDNSRTASRVATQTASYSNFSVNDTFACLSLRTLGSNACNDHSNANGVSGRSDSGNTTATLALVLLAAIALGMGLLLFLR